MLRPSETTTTEDSDRHVEVSPELLAHHIRRHLRCSENGMQAGVDGHGLVYAIAPAVVIIAPFLFHERQEIRTVAIYLVGAGETERRFAAEVSRGDEKVQ